ncbi:MAG: WD40/YVTN/BNR-like repeat-containing protein, partial [Rhodanobacteraceae bacterium]
VLYAAAWQAYRTPWKLSSGGPGSGLYKTTDGGAHWTNISHHAGLPTGLLGKIGVAVAANDPDVVYAAIQAKGGGVFKSSDAGKTWKRVNKVWNLRQRAFYYMAITVDPTDPDRVYMAQVDALFVSQDGGKTFKKLDTPHGDNHIVWINPNDSKILLEGNDGGATVSRDRGKTWSSELNQPTGQFYHVNLDDQFPFHLYGAQQDEGSIDGPSATADGRIPLSDWKTVAYGESTTVVPQPGTPSNTYGSGYYSIFAKYNMATKQFQSVSPWPDYKDGASSAELKYRFAWTYPILFSPVNPKQLLVGSQYVMTSDDYGRTWKTISPDLTRNDPVTEGPTGGPIELDQTGAEVYPTISALAVSPLDGKVIWAGSSDGLVNVTTDGGTNWQAVRPPTLPAWSDISSIEPSYATKGTAYLTASRYMWDDFAPYVFKTTDYGKHWTAITKGLPDDQYVFDVRQDPNDVDLLFLGTKNTVYVSFDGGDRWQPMTLNLPHVQVRGVAINTREGEVAIATHGRAFWVLDNLTLLEQMTQQPNVGTDTAAVFAPEPAWLTQSYGGPRSPKDNAGTNPPFGATVFFNIPESYAGKTPVTLAFTDAQGKTIRSFTLHLKQKSKKKPDTSEMTPQQQQALALKKLTAIKPGMDRFQWNLSYPDATRVKNFTPPAAAGGLAISVTGPEVVPGTYHVVLDYNDRKTVQTFKVALDPGIDSSQSDLQASLDLQLKIHQELDTLDKALNEALDVRQQLQSAMAAHHVEATPGNNALSELNSEIDALVQMNIHSSEADAMHQPRLHGRLAYLQTDVGMAWVKPTQAQYAVSRFLQKQARAGEQQLQAAVDNAKKLL